ncbi:cupredoxin domain-containing protein [Sinorhizobium numidicum]|uniref:Cupredoxin domain-containing protein n=1 Tax=Sinorhizobium numidicum TaxID=680248 RepID=A0ABY8CRQ4_9HYPH|nr:cupredoxin domain-containing protein [Sinorhizobium numidicum]WEX74020.1 cupredoxin domain-containing protein [Sinorhizobium numidicum]WEX80005.1 cupredoxin domain-containing protein [Sinorhizobium numidicum]
MRRHLFGIFACAFLVTNHAAATEFTIKMAGASYRPASIKAAVGDTIRFVNDDAAKHNVFVPTAGYALDLGAQEPGQEKVLSVHKVGRFEVECVIHPHMLTVVEVE